MITLACLAAAGLVLGLCFNVYALAALCLTSAVVDAVWALQVGPGRAALALAGAILVIQAGYGVGLCAATLRRPARSDSLPATRR
jgi:hypothetical protein